MIRHVITVTCIVDKVKTYLSVIVALAITVPLHTGTVSGDCTFNGKRLYGKIQVVDYFPDIKVKVVTSFPDLKVQKVNVFPDSCGKWQMVTVFPDLKIKFVDHFPDIKIQYVDHFPGLH